MKIATSQFIPQNYFFTQLQPAVSTIMINPNIIDTIVAHILESTVLPEIRPTLTRVWKFHSPFPHPSGFESF